ncbi:acyl transferase/acyl hydrolase/lysophospholipase, partial [Ochromonadaceae sp. CCMP2298]
RLQLQYAPALVALQYCLSCVWVSNGLLPGAVIGHSLGELAAAAVTGVLSIEDALGLACLWGQTRGGAYAVACSEDTVRTAISHLAPTEAALVSIVAVNGPQACVLSGAEGPLQMVIQRLPEVVPIPGHSHSPLVGAYRQALEGVQFGPLLAGVSFISTVRGRPVSAAELAQVQV